VAMSDTGFILEMAQASVIFAAVLSRSGTIVCHEVKKGRWYSEVGLSAVEILSVSGQRFGQFSHTRLGIH